MEFGLLLHTRQLIRSEDAAKSFDQLWNDAAQAEELGFDHIWLGDSVTVLDKARGDCLTTMAALAARTEKVRLGAVPMLAALRNPVLLAHALATIDVISNGRVIIGVSVGPTRDYIQRQFAACGVPPQEKAGRLSECVEITCAGSGARRPSTTKAAITSYTMWAFCRIPRSARARRSGSSPTETKPDSSESAGWATVGSRWRRRWKDFPRRAA